MRRNVADTEVELGADRVLAPVRVLPQPAERLDASGPVRSAELEVAVERLCLDSTSFAQIRAEAEGDPAAIATRVREIVEARGKMHNPVTDSGGVLLGTVIAVGDSYPSPPALGSRIVSLASLTLTPLRIDEIVEVDPDSAQILVRGTAYLPARAPWGPLPDDLPIATAIELYDVYGAGSHTRLLAPAEGTVLILGAGHAGKLAMAAAKDAMKGGTVAVADVDEDAVALALDAGLCDVGVVADLRDPLGALGSAYDAGLDRADLTVVVVNATGCETTAILLTADGGTILFYSMATSFQTAALAADGSSCDVRMLIGNGFAPDRGRYALDLARRSRPLRSGLGLSGVAA